MKNLKTNIKKIIPYIVVYVIYLIVYLSMTGKRDSIIIEKGIRYFNSLKIIGTIILIVLSIILIVRIVVAALLILKKENALKEAYRKELEAEEAEREKKAYLSVKKNMDSDELKEKLDNAIKNKKWPESVKAVLKDSITQLQKMDSYQEKLQSLLDKNGANSLNNSQDMLDKVEQYLCKNVRKILNYLEVADEDGDMEVLLSKITSKQKDNKDKLAKVQEFLFNMADFLNSQGNDDNSLEILNLYQTTILESIQEHKKETV